MIIMLKENQTLNGDYYQITYLMIEHSDGSWEPKDTIAVHTSSGGQVTLKPGDRMQPGVIFGN